MRTVGVWAAAWLTALLGLPWVWAACARASWATLGRDQGIFQYVAWAASQGDVAYRDTRDVNGPLTYAIHHAMLLLGGADEHRFRVLDLAFVALTAAVFGATLPSMTGRASPLARIGGALAAIVVVLSQYLGYGFWDTAQRESFFDGFLLASIGIQIEATQRKSRGLLALAGALSFATWLGKPTCALFTVLQLVALGSDRMSTSRLGRFVWFGAGGALGAAVPIAWMLRFGDARAWLRITFVDVPAMYRFIWPRPIGIIFALYRDGILMASVVSFALVALVLLGKMPRRALPIGTFALAGLVSLFAQRKAFPYHMHPVSLGTAVSMLSIVWWIAATSKRRLGVALAIVLAGALGARSALMAAKAPFPTAAQAQDLDVFVRPDFFPTALRKTAARLQSLVHPDERVQVYGMDPYLLFLARRRSATPYIYAYDLDDYWALIGAYEPGGLQPDEEQRRAIRAMRDAHEKDMLARLKERPPAAFVFIDESPLMSHRDAFVDFVEHCPDASAWMLLRYHETEGEPGIRIFVRADTMR